MLLTLFFIIKMGLMVGLEAFLMQALLPFLGLPFKIGFYIVAFTIHALVHILLLLGPGGLGYYLYWLFHRRMERKLEKRRASLSHHDTPLRRERHSIFVIFGVMNGLLIPLVIGFIAIIDYEILSDWLKEDEGRLPIFLLASIGFVSILVMILMRGKMMGVKLTLILIVLTALSSMINNTPHHILQALNIIQLSHHNATTAKILGDYGAALILWLGPGLILFWLHALFQRPLMGPELRHKRAVMIKHVGIALYLGFSAAALLFIAIDSMRVFFYNDLTQVFYALIILMPPGSFPSLFSLTFALYSLAIMLVYWRYLSLGFLARLMLSLAPSLPVNIWIHMMLYSWGIDR